MKKIALTIALAVASTGLTFAAAAGQNKPATTATSTANKAKKHKKTKKAPKTTPEKK